MGWWRKDFRGLVIRAEVGNSLVKSTIWVYVVVFMYSKRVT